MKSKQKTLDMIAKGYPWTGRFLMYTYLLGFSQPEDMGLDALCTAHREYKHWIAEGLLEYREETPAAFTCSRLCDHDGFDGFLAQKVGLGLLVGVV